jgi:hypothetical protein
VADAVAPGAGAGEPGAEDAAAGGTDPGAAAAGADAAAPGAAGVSSSESLQAGRASRLMVRNRTAERCLVNMGLLDR